MPPSDHGMGGDGGQNMLLGVLIFGLGEFLGQVEIIPANDAVFD